MKAEVPLVYEVILLLEKLEVELKGVRDETLNPVPAVIRVTAQASLLVLNKYYLLAEVEVYQIALSLCALTLSEFIT